MTIQSAYDTVISGQSDIIKVKAGEQTPEILMFDNDVTVKIEGGYDDSFSSVVSDSECIGTLTISGGQVTISDLIIK